MLNEKEIIYMLKKYQFNNPLFQQQRKLGFRLHLLNLARIKSRPSEVRLQQTKRSPRVVSTNRSRIQLMQKQRIFDENSRLVDKLVKTRTNMAIRLPKRDSTKVLLSRDCKHELDSSRS